MRKLLILVIISMFSIPLFAETAPYTFTQKEWRNIDLSYLNSTIFYILNKKQNIDFKQVSSVPSATRLYNKQLILYNSGASYRLYSKINDNLKYITFNIEDIANTWSGENTFSNTVTVTTITATTLNVSGVVNFLPAGTITMYGGSTAPTGWFVCDGSTVSRTTYATLYAIIGETYGAGDSSTNFSLPDFRGVFAVGSGTTTRVSGVDASGSQYASTLGDYEQDHFQGHRHLIRDSNGSQYSAGLIQSGSDASVLLYPSGVTTGYAAEPVDDGTHGTPRTGHATEPQSLSVNYIIRY